MRAIGYFRAGTEEGAHHDVERAFESYCRVNMHQPITTFTSSGEDDRDQDAGYRQMVEYLRESGGEYLVVIPGARSLGADLESVARSMVELEGIGAKVTCLDDDFPDPVQNAFHTLGIKGVSRTRSQSIKASMRARASLGQALGKPLYGYRIGPDGKLEVVEHEAAVVELIFRLYTREGLGLRLIAQHLNERGILTRRGGKWNVVSIRDLLRNVSYMGTYTRFGMRRPKVHEAIIPPEVFHSAQDLTTERRPVGRVARPEPFLLSGVVYCGYCGNKMMGVTRRQSWKRQDGRRARGVYRYYQCQSRNNQSLCGYHTWREALLEGTVLSQLKYALEARRSQGQNGDESDAARRERVRAMREARVRNADRRFHRALKRVARGEVGVGTLAGYLEGLDVARRGASGTGGPVDVAATLAGWDSLDLEAQRSFLAEHVARIDVHDDRIEVVV
jgi:hypothetical protein